ncbi:MAG: ABC transporter ATP-binding protein, partial [Defluviitaleaceae bacterium]|nr:ABC transporter ATP-binding protein [Defluviitaleaceae bacterium]
MELRGKKYKTSDIFRLPFRAAPVFVVIKVVVAVLQATMPTVVTALATAFFVDTALAVFADEMAASSIYLPLGVLIGVVGVGSV